MKKENRYTRNSHNVLNESGNQMLPNKSNVQIAHMEAKPLLIMVMIFFFMLLIMGLFGFFMVQNQIHDLDLKLEQVKNRSTQPAPYVVYHDRENT